MFCRTHALVACLNGKRMYRTGTRIYASIAHPAHDNAVRLKGIITAWVATQRPTPLLESLQFSSNLFVPARHNPTLLMPLHHDFLVPIRPMMLITLSTLLLIVTFVGDEVVMIVTSVGGEVVMLMTSAGGKEEAPQARSAVASITREARSTNPTMGVVSSLGSRVVPTKTHHM